MVKITFVIFYVLVMVLIGYVSMKKTKTLNDYFLGGRNIGPWMSAFAYGTTYFSAVLFIGYAGRLGWGFGIYTMLIVLGNTFIGTTLAWLVLGPRTRTMTARLNAMTMPEFLEARYGSAGLKLVASLIIFIFLVPYTASAYMGLSYLFEVNLQISYTSALAFMAVLTGVYLIMGGYFAVTLTDFIQGIIMLFGSVCMVAALITAAGGFSHTVGTLMDPAYAPALKAPGPIPGWLTLTSLVFMTSFGPWGLPQMVQKFYSIKSEKQITRAVIICTVFSLVITFVAYFSGALTHLFYQKPPENLDQLMPTLLTEHTPNWIAIVILLLVISASMSTISSLVLVSSSAIAIDLYSGILNKKASKESTVLLMRILCGVFMALSLFLALKQITFIVNMMLISWGVVSGSFLAPYLYGLFWKRTTKPAAYIGVFSGLLTAVYLYNQLGKPGIPLSAMISILVPLILVPIVSLVTKPFPKEHLDKVYGEK